MKYAKIIILSILSIIDLYVLYSAIGYLVLGIKTPKIIGETNTTFTGMYIMSIVFTLIFLCLTGVIVFLAVKFYKKKKSKISPQNNCQ